MAINKYTNPIQNTLEQYVPIPFQEMLQAGAKIQERGDLAEQQQIQVQSGLSSMEALTPGYANFRDKFANDYKTSAGSLLDKYQGNTSNPEFIRDIKRLNTQYAADPRLSTIKQGNELYKQNQQIATKLKAEGKLYIQPDFTGLDTRGNLTANVPSIQGVNTLEDWTNAFKVAHESMEDIGNKTTNTRNLSNAKKSILGDTLGQAKLLKAYIQQGLSPEDAQRALQSNITGLVNTYGKVEKVNTGLLNYDLNVSQFDYQKQKDKQALDLDKYKAETARLKTAGKGDVNTNAPSFNEFTNRLGSIGEIGDTKNKQYIFGSGYSQYGTSDKAVKNEKVSGKIYDISSGDLKPTSKSIDIVDGKIKGYMNAWVDKKTGELLKTDTPTSKPKLQYINGKPFAYKDGKPYEVEERTVAEYNYNAGTKDKPDLRTIYKEAAPNEAMREMGYSNAYYEGMGRTQHGNIFDSNKKVKLDDKFIESTPELRGYLPAFKDAQDKVNKGTQTKDDLDLLNILQNYDSRKSIYNKEILPYFENQGKTKSIVQE